MKKTKKQKNIPEAKNSKLRLLCAVGFLLGFQLGLVLYVLSNFFKERSGSDNVGVFYIIAYIISFFVLLNLHKLIRRHGKYNLFIFFLFLKAFALLGMGLFFNGWIALFFGMFSLASDALTWACLDLVVENYSKDEVTGKIRGGLLTAINAGILASPFFSTWIVENLGYQYVFFVAAGLNFLAVLIIIVCFGKINHNIRKDIKIREVLGKIIKNRNLARIYYISLILEVFYAITVVYTPLYLLDLGVSWVEIGKIFTIMLIPFVVIQYPLGIIADRKTGEKEWLFLALAISGFFTASISFLETSHVLIWMGVLFMTRIGAAIIEIMRDSYFYKNVGPRDVDIMNYFRTTRSVAYVLAMVVSGLFLVFFETRYVFLLLAIILFSGLLPLWKLKDTR